MRDHRRRRHVRAWLMPAALMLMLPASVQLACSPAAGTACCGGRLTSAEGGNRGRCHGAMGIVFSPGRLGRGIRLAASV